MLQKGEFHRICLPTLADIFSGLLKPVLAVAHESTQDVDADSIAMTVIVSRLTLVYVDTLVVAVVILHSVAFGTRASVTLQSKSIIVAPLFSMGLALTKNPIGNH